MNISDAREKELWEKIKPFLIGCHLREDAPADIVEADAELRKLAWENLLVKRIER